MDSLELQDIGFFAFILTVIAGAVTWAVLADRKRTEAMRLLASSMGFSFSTDLPLTELAGAGVGLPVFQHGRSRKIKRALHGEVAGQKAWILDYQYTTGGGKEHHTHYQTVVLFPEGACLPTLDLSPENFLHRVASVFGYQDLNVDRDLAFSKAYLLRGSDESAIRALFGPIQTAWFASNPGWHVETQGPCMAVYRTGSYAEVEAVRKTLNDAAQIRSLLGGSEQASRI